MNKLRAYLKERGIRGNSTMKKQELEEEVQKLKEQEKLEKYEEGLRHNAVCSACLEQQRIQRQIDEKTHNERLFELTIRDLVCEYCKHANLAQDGDDTFCVLCGALQSPGVNASYR